MSRVGLNPTWDQNRTLSFAGLRVIESTLYTCVCLINIMLTLFWKYTCCVYD